MTLASRAPIHPVGSVARAYLVPFWARLAPCGADALTPACVNAVLSRALTTIVCKRI